jgi:hypothetical protein
MTGLGVNVLKRSGVMLAMPGASGVTMADGVIVPVTFDRAVINCGAKWVVVGRLADPIAALLLNTLPSMKAANKTPPINRKTSRMMPSPDIPG